MKKTVKNIIILFNNVIITLEKQKMGDYICRNAPNNSAFSLFVPTVMRRQPSQSLTEERFLTTMPSSIKY